MSSSEAEQSGIEHAAAVGAPVQEAVKSNQNPVLETKGSGGSKEEATKLTQG